MQVPVLLEKIDKGYRARAGDPFCLTAEGTTTTEALAKLRKLLLERRDSGASIVYLDIPHIDHPMARWAGSLDPDAPSTKEWEKAMADYRQQCEEDPDY